MEIKQSSTQKYERNSFKYFLREIIQAYDLFVCKRFVFYSIIKKIAFEMVHVTRKKLLKHLPGFDGKMNGHSTSNFTSLHFIYQNLLDLHVNN